MKVLPFPCIRPIPEQAAAVASLPYDLFDQEAAVSYASSRPLSFLNIDRPETLLGAHATQCTPQAYQQAAHLFETRLDEGAFIEDRNRSFYIYELTWRGRTHTGVVGICSIDECDTGVIRAHELTRPEKQRDRADLIRATGAQTSPVVLTYRDQPVLDIILSAAKGGAALYDFTDETGVRQRVWEIARPESVEAINALFATIPRAYIADGHHRCAAAVDVAHELRETAQQDGSYTGKEPFNYFLAALFPASQLSVLPYNRVIVDRCGMSASDLCERIRSAGFDVTRSDAPVEPYEARTFGMYTENTWWKLSANERLCTELDTARPVEALDTSLLQHRILEPLLCLKDVRNDSRIAFIGSPCGTDELERRAGVEGVAFTLPATDIEQMFDVADAGLLMPPKSTWFEPKSRSGLFVHRIARRS